MPELGRKRLEVLAETAHGIDVDLEIGIVGRGEKWKPLDVIPVRVRDEKMHGAEFGLHQFNPQVPDSRTGVKNADGVPRRDRHAGSLPAVTEIVGSGRRHGAARSPQREISGLRLERGAENFALFRAMRRRAAFRHETGSGPRREEPVDHFRQGRERERLDQKTIGTERGDVT